jgi:uncharacterized protein with HEPN domain
MYVDDHTRLRHMRDAVREAIEMATGQRREDLDTDRKLCLSLVHLLETIGEAAKGVSPEYRHEHPDLPWKKIAGMRDRLVHGYFEVNLDIVWRTVTEDLPPIRRKRGHAFRIPGTSFCPPVGDHARGRTTRSLCRIPAQSVL